MNEPKKGFEVANDQQIATRIQAAIMNDVTLRKWCIEKAIERLGAQPESAVALANDIFEFLTKKEEAPPVEEPPTLDYRN